MSTHNLITSTSFGISFGFTPGEKPLPILTTAAGVVKVVLDQRWMPQICKWCFTHTRIQSTRTKKIENLKGSYFLHMIHFTRSLLFLSGHFIYDAIILKQSLGIDVYDNLQSDSYYNMNIFISHPKIEIWHEVWD